MGLWRYLFPALAICLAWTLTKNHADAGSAESVGFAVFDRCGTLSENNPRSQCLENVASDQPAKPGLRSEGSWRLLRTINPRGGSDAISITHVADPNQSDLDLVGLMLRCADTGVEVLIVVVQPFRLQDRPSVSFNFAGKSVGFEATVVPPGMMILLPGEAGRLATGSWQSLSELAVKIDNAQVTIRGIIPISGLPSALQLLMATCLNP